MDQGISWWSAFVAFGSAALGAAAATATAWWTLARNARAAREEQRQRDRDALSALLFEVEVAQRIASRGSVTELPTILLTGAASSLGALDVEARRQVAQYAEAVHRYNGRARRLVLYAAAKRARGENPGAEPVSSHHVDPVVRQSKSAIEALQRVLRTQ
jgi:hypothetical protein